MDLIGTHYPLSIDEFLRLSADVNLHLQARPFSGSALLDLILGPARLPDQVPVLEAISYLQDGYGERRRKNGTLAILHPLRTAALLARRMSQPTFLDFFGALLHDKEEDLTTEALGATEWGRLQDLFGVMLEKLDGDHRWFLGERIALLSRKPGQSYHEYLAAVLEKARVMGDLLHCKLADRLDNTLDIAVQYRGSARQSFFETAFGVLFLPAFEVPAGRRDQLPQEDRCVLLLSQLFKNAVFMSLLRAGGFDEQDQTTQRLFADLAETSRSQAEWIAMELLRSHLPDPAARYAIVRETMTYCHDGGLEAVRERARGGVFDGTFLERYAVADEVERKRQLAEIYRDRSFFARLMILFVAMFTRFLNDREYYIQGIGPEGINAVE
ncbi:MAG TPA: hypothetical protein VGQ83_36280 [Polyangia bacterium]|jgi:hypothetical protein